MSKKSNKHKSSNAKSEMDPSDEDTIISNENTSVDFDIKKMLKPDFIEKYKKLLGDNYESFILHSSKYPRKSIRVNTLKISVKDLVARLSDNWILTPIPWCNEGFWIEHRKQERYDIGNLLEHQLGYIYVQDASSMIPPVVLNPKSNSIVLDMCAAPGSKTSQLAMYMNNTGLLVANDSQGKRLSALGINLQRCGVHNCIVSKNHGQKYPLKEGSFDYILVDAPCSGTGTINRSFKVLEMYSDSIVNRMSSIQKLLLQRAFQLLKRGGKLVYSTCTLEPAENEVQVSNFLNSNPSAKVLPITLPINRSNPITFFENENLNEQVKNCLRIYPMDNNSEGFFVTLITKE